MHSATTESAADADAHFAERLLRGGVAPRHVRRSLRELRDHRSDIRQQLERQGRHPLDATHEAQLLLGHRDALAEQILARPELRSKARRFAWLLFGVMPIFATIMLSVTVFFTALFVSGSASDSSSSRDGSRRLVSRLS
jgi:transposase